VILVDSAVWIDWLNGRPKPAVALLDRLLEEDIVAIAGVILQEILQGARGPAEFEILRAAFSGLVLLLPTEETYVRAAMLYARCRWQGVTPRSPHDCLIAQTAIEHDVPLLHDDRDFERIAIVESGLKLLRA